MTSNEAPEVAPDTRRGFVLPGGAMPHLGHGDPLLKGKDWERVKAHWRRARVPQCQAKGCKAPHIPIDYEGPRGPFSLDVGHIVSRAQAKAAGWTRQQINDLRNTRPEHATCSRSAGAIDGNASRAGTPAPRSEGW